MIQVERLTKTFGAVRAVDGVSFEARRGEILGLLGPNGAGKTTTLRMLTGYLAPTSGRIRVGDYSTPGDPLEVKRITGYLPESAPLYPEMLVFDYLAFIAAARAIPAADRRRRIGDAAELCGIREVMHQPIAEISKGYKQRVGLAAVMLADPEILVLDEPTSGLDPNQIAEIREIIRRIGRAKTVIFSTHILSEAEATCDRVVIIHRGRIAADRPTAELKEALGGKIRLAILLEGADADGVERTLAPVAGVEELSCGPPDEAGRLPVAVVFAAGADPRAEIYRRIRGTDWTLLDFHLQRQSLEEVFRELTREG
ncbi:MAG: ATP-binding cassette domain-containing protein [Desulfobacterales bacterium]